VVDTAGVSLLSSAFAGGQFAGIGSGGTPAKILGSGFTLTTKGLLCDSLVIDNMPLVVDTSTTQPLQFDNVTFQNFSPSAVQLDITRTSIPGATFTNLKFLTTPTTGFHLRVNDPAIGNGAFSVTLVTPTPTKGNGAVFTTTGEAIIIWP
jgi:hypothetical protein